MVRLMECAACRAWFLAGVGGADVHRCPGCGAQVRFADPSSGPFAYKTRSVSWGRHEVATNRAPPPDEPPAPVLLRRRRLDPPARGWRPSWPARIVAGMAAFQLAAFVVTRSGAEKPFHPPPGPPPRAMNGPARPEAEAAKALEDAGIEPPGRPPDPVRPRP